MWGEGFTIIEKGGEVRVINNKVYVCVAKFDHAHDAQKRLRAFRGGIIYKDNPTEKNRFERHAWIMMEAEIADPKPGKKPDIRSKYPIPTSRVLFPPLPTLEERTKSTQSMLKRAKMSTEEHLRDTEEHFRLHAGKMKKAAESEKIAQRWKDAAKRGK